jgi:hypothetical protein
VSPRLFPTTLPGFEPGPSTDGISPDGQGGRPFGAGTTGACCNLPLTRPPAAVLSIRTGRRAGYVPACKGSVDSPAARPCPWPELAAAGTFACQPHVYLGRTCPGEAARRARAFLIAGLRHHSRMPCCEGWAAQAYASPCSWVRSWGKSFLSRISAILKDAQKSLPSRAGTGARTSPREGQRRVGRGWATDRAYLGFRLSVSLEKEIAGKLVESRSHGK